MSEKLTIKDIAEIVYSDGLEAAIMDIIDPMNIEDIRLKKFFSDAFEALNNIDRILDTETLEDDSDLIWDTESMDYYQNNFDDNEWDWEGEGEDGEGEE